MEKAVKFDLMSNINFFLTSNHLRSVIGCPNDRLLLLRHYSLVVFVDIG